MKLRIIVLLTGAKSLKKLKVKGLSLATLIGDTLMSVETKAEGECYAPNKILFPVTEVLC